MRFGCSSTRICSLPRGIGIDEVQQAIASHNVNKPTGTLYGSQRAFSVEATGQLNDAAAYRPLVVAYRNGAAVRLGALGRVVDGVQNDKYAAWYNDERTVILAIQRQPGTNTVELVDAIRKLLPTFREQAPTGIKIDVMYDRSQSIRASVADVKFTLLLALALVVMVIFIFLRNVSATLIPSLALPMSIIGTFSVMYLLGFSLDNISLMALTLCVGLVVDDAIVVLENITRHMEMGESPLEATLNGTEEIGFTVLSMTLSLVAVFIPVLFMGGILGRLLYEFAVTIMVAVLVSGFVSLTLTPLLAAHLLKPTDHAGTAACIRRRSASSTPGDAPTNAACCACWRARGRPWRPSCWWSWPLPRCSSIRPRASCRATTSDSSSPLPKRRRMFHSRR
jgi:HAE1 family hydrophobic/amphiphilic exporter-1